MSQLHLNVSEARRTMVKKMLSKCLRDWLKDEEANYEKDRKRDRGNNLLANNIDGLI